LHSQLAWYIGGPLLGLCVVALRWLLNERLGVTGAWSDVIERMSSRSVAFGTRGWFLIGLTAGATGYALVAGGATFEGCGWLTDTFGSSGGGAVLVAGILLVAGVLIGFGAKMAGGCTSGNGLSGNAMTSPASVVATITFFGTAIVVSFLIEALIR